MAEAPNKKVSYNDRGDPHYSQAISCNHGVTDGGKSLLGSIMEYAATAVAGINTAAAIRMADMQYDIAKRYLDIAKWWRDWYNNNYRPWENVELAEAKALTPVTPMYDITVGRHKTFGRLQARGLAHKAIKCTSAYCTGLRQSLLKDYMDSEATSLAALENMGYRNEQAYVLARNDVRWRRRVEVMNRGRGMIASNVQYATLASGIFGDLGKQAGAAAGGALRYLGYAGERIDPAYNSPLQFGSTPRQMDSRIDITPVRQVVPVTPVDPYMSGDPNAASRGGEMTRGTPSRRTQPVDYNPNWGRG